MSQIIFVPYLPLAKSLHLSCSDDMRVPNRLIQYKNLLFTNEQVSYFKLTPDCMEQRAKIFQIIQNYDVLVREFVDEKNFTYVLELVASHDLEYHLLAENIPFTS